MRNVSTSFCASVRPSDGAGNSRQESRARQDPGGGEERFQRMFHVMLIIS